jgi:hypothetical protein
MSTSVPTVYAPAPSPAVLDTMVKIIMSQTDMSRERVVTELERTNYDLKRVIRDYMRGGDSEVKDCAVSDAAGAATATATATAASSTNQLRFSEIRNFMDKSSEMYYRRKEMERIYNEVLEKKRAAAAAAAASEAATETTAASKL